MEVEPDACFTDTSKARRLVNFRGHPFVWFTSPIFTNEFLLPNLALLSEVKIRFTAIVALLGCRPQMSVTSSNVMCHRGML